MSLNNDQEILQAVVKKAWKEPSFKNNLLNNPVSTLEEFLGRSLEIPHGKKIVFVDQTDASTIFINIPAEEDSADRELCEEQLDMISGGLDAAGDPPIFIKPVNGGDDLFGEG